VEKKTIYTKEFKIYCVKQTIHSNRETREIAKRLGVSHSLLVQWCHQYIEELNNLDLLTNDNKGNFIIRKISKDSESNDNKGNFIIRKISKDSESNDNKGIFISK
jgi:transposase-like protein